ILTPPTESRKASDYFGRVAQKIAPSAHQNANAIHSEREKLPGTDGSTFIATIAAETTAPAAASAMPTRGETSPGARRARARKETHVASQPTPTARDPTSVTGTSRASPRKAAAAVRAVISRTAKVGVPKRGCTRASQGWTSPRLPMPKSRRVDA